MRVLFYACLAEAALLGMVLVTVLWSLDRRGERWAATTRAKRGEPVMLESLLPRAVAIPAAFRKSRKAN